MTTTDATRVPLSATRIVSTFGIGVVGFMSANLVPFMILAIQDSFGIGATEAGTLMTACLLSTALACLAVTRFTEGRGRFLVARIGLATTVLGFGLAAADLTPVLSGIGVIVGGLGGGGAVAAGGAALAALRNPNRVSGISGLTNRAIVTVVLAVIPIIGIGMFSAFGLLAALALLAFFTVGWLPMAHPAVDPSTDAATTAADPATDPARTGAIVTTRTGTQRRRTPTRTIAVAGSSLLTMFAVWALGEDSLWAMSGAIGISQAGMTDEDLGLVLSASTGGGLVAAIALIFVGARLGRALPLAVLVVAGGTLKLVACLTTDPTLFLVTMIAWNTIYAIAFMYIVATAAALDASGRWSGPVLGVYLIGSSFAPLFGAWIAESFGFAALGVTLAAISFILLVPLVVVARLSTRVEHEQREDAEASPDIDTVRSAGV